MDDASFTLSEHLRVLHLAGIRTLLPGETKPATPGLLDHEPWPTFMAKLPPSPSTIWTYSELGSDLSGQASKARGDLWRRIIPALQLPKGFVGFFPYAIPQEGTMQWCTKHFIQAISMIQPATVVVFDDDAHNELVVAFRSELPVNMDPGQIHTAPGPQTLLSCSPESLHSTLERLKSILFTR